MNIEKAKKLVRGLVFNDDGTMVSYIDFTSADYDTWGGYTLKEYAEAIETLLTAYEKEKGENVKLRLQDIPLIEGELKAYKDRVNELKQEVEKEKEKNKKINKYIEDRVKIGKDIQTFINEDYVEQEYISKDKIKAKIEEYKKQQKEETDAYLCIKVLLSLLEKE